MSYDGTLLAVLLLLCPPTLRAQASRPDAPDANPARPTVSTPATLTPVGYLQFENGVLYATDSPEFSKRLGINQVTKFIKLAPFSYCPPPTTVPFELICIP